MSERLYTKDDVSQIVRQRVNKLNERIHELEIELEILKLDKELIDYERESDRN
jgi:DNA-dependent RNA polymerase auxiliary subunit epsilon